MAGERVDTPDTTVLLGIVRNTNGRADIDGKVSLGRKTASSLIGAGLHGGGGLKATLGGHILSTFVIPRLLYEGLDGGRSGIHYSLKFWPIIHLIKILRYSLK